MCTMVVQYDTHPYINNNYLYICVCQVSTYSFEPTRAQARQAGLEEVIERGDSEQLCRLMNLDWCWCGPHRCIIMPTAKECLCCWDMHYCNELRGSSACITLHVNFQYVALNKEILQKSIAQSRTRLGLAPGDNKQQNSDLRHQAYKNFAHWILRNEVRKLKRIVLPSCVVSAIRKCFPSND